MILINILIILIELEYQIYQMKIEKGWKMLMIWE